MKKFLKTIAALAIVSPTASFAQDLYDWTGWSGGLGISSVSGDGAQLPLAGAIGGVPDQEPSGWALGGQIAYDNQFANNMVLGVTMDLNFGDIDDSVADGNFLKQTSEIKSFGGVKVRLGYAADRWMPYATIGLGFANVGYGQSCPGGAMFGTCATSGKYDVSGDSLQSGITAGLGVRYAATDKWIVGLDYSYTDLGGDTYSFNVPGNRLPSTRYFDTTYSVWKLTADYRF